LSSNIIDYLRIGPHTNRQDINKILADLQDLNAQDPEDAALQERVALWDSRRKKTSSIGKSGAVDQSISHTRDRRTEEVTMQMPTSCETFPFIDTLNGAPTFPAGVENGGTKFGGRGTFDGSSDYITIANIVGSNLDLERTDSFSIAFCFKRADAGGNELIFAKRDNIDNAAVGYSILINTTGRITFDICDGTNEIKVQSSLDKDDDAWHTCVVTYGGASTNTDMNMYIDGSLDNGIQNGTTLASTIINTLVNAIGAESDGGRKLVGSLAWVMILKEEVNSTWASE